MVGVFLQTSDALVSEYHVYVQLYGAEYKGFN